MSMDNIYCLGDGFAHGHIWPEWPQIVTALLPRCRVHTITGVGAGNEFLINGLLQQDVANQLVIFQWANEQRFDKLIQDDVWHEISKSDTVYHSNVYCRDGDIWWLSSSSQLRPVRLYHDFYVQSKQAQYRVLNQKKLVRGYLKSLDCRYIELSTDEQDLYSKQSRFALERGNQVQPKPYVHLKFFEEVILPELGVSVDPLRLSKLRTLICSIDWKPYDPDRAEIWSDIIRNLDIAT